MEFKKEVSAGGIVFKKERDTIVWLITQHSQHKGWGFPKGLIGDTVRNEPMEVAALREVREEGGIEAKIINPTPIEVHYKYKFQNFLVEKSVHFFLMEYVSGDPKDHDWEVQEARFVPEEEVLETLTYKTEKEAFEKALAIFKTL